MVFTKNDGTIKKFYIEPCKLILQAKPHITNVTKGRSDDICYSYECYQINMPNNIKRSQRRSIQNKITEICNEFGYKVTCWYSLNGVSAIDIIEDDINKMINVISDAFKK